MPFLASFLTVSVALIAAIVPTFQLPGSTPADKPPFPAPPGYVLPWIGGEIQAVTQGEETSVTHNGLAAYAFDFDLNYGIVVAARAGKVVMVRQDSTAGGCSGAYSGAANYVVIDHGDGTSALYLHLAPAAVFVKPGQFIDQGQAIAVSGETGLTCSDDMKGPGRHLHFQVERTEDGRHYFTQSLPIAFDDISKNDGVPQEGQSYVSGNFGRGKPQKIKLTPHHDPRPFNPVATPADPSLLEGDHDATPVPADTPTPDLGPAVDGASTPEETSTSRPTHTPTPRPTHTPTPTVEAAPSDTPAPAPSDTPVPASTPVPTDTPPSPTATPTPTPMPPTATDTPSPPPDTPTPTPTA